MGNVMTRRRAMHVDGSAMHPSTQVRPWTPTLHSYRNHPSSHPRKENTERQKKRGSKLAERSECSIYPSTQPVNQVNQVNQAATRAPIHRSTRPSTHLPPMPPCVLHFTHHFLFCFSPSVVLSLFVRFSRRADGSLSRAPPSHPQIHLPMDREREKDKGRGSEM